MARKKRRLEPVAVAAADQKPKERYQDSFQHNVGHRIEEAGKKLEGQGRNILYALGALVILGIAIWIFYAWNSRSGGAAQAALGKAIETSGAPVTETAPMAGSTQKVYKTEKERAEAAIAQFQDVESKYGGSVGEKAKYFAAVNRLVLDRPAGIQELEALAGSRSPVGKLSKFALAQAKAGDGKTDEAIALYRELSEQSDPVISKETIDFELAKLYEKQGNKQEAVNLLFDLVKTASEAKDLDGKPVPLSPTAENAKDKLKELDPQKASEIPEPAEPSVMPFGG
jgi:tetratricopeptide (TPR) repeat protein